MTVKEALKKCMKAKGLTQGEVAERMGTTQANLSMRMSNDDRMVVANLMKTLEVCGFDLVVVDREDPKNVYVLGGNEKLAESMQDVAMDDRIRKIVAEEIAKQLNPEG